MIPAWVRALAAAVALAGVLAIVFLVRNAPDQVAGLADFLRLAAQAILFLCLVVLSGYVAITGLPPAHLWGLSGLTWWPAETEFKVTPELQRFLALLRRRHAGLQECWLLDTGVPEEWRLLVMADGAVLDAVRGDWDIRRKNVRVYLVDAASGTVAPAWGRSSPEAFATWDWEPQGDKLAEFRCPVGGEIRLAQRLWS